MKWLKRWFPPFGVGDERSWPYRDTFGGCSPLEYVGLYGVLLTIWTILRETGVL